LLWVAGLAAAWVLLQRQLLLLLLAWPLRVVGPPWRAGLLGVVGLLLRQLQQVRLRCRCAWRWIPWTGTRWTGCT
jgi:hypothetical protein